MNPFGRRAIFKGLIEFSFGVASSDAARKMNVAKGSIATSTENWHVVR